MLMRAYIFIDGENLRGVIEGACPGFNRADYLPKADWSEFFPVHCRKGESARNRCGVAEIILVCRGRC